MSYLKEIIRKAHEYDALMESFKTPPQPKIKEFEDCTNVIILPKHDTLDNWNSSSSLPYKDEILIGYNDIRVVYKLGDGIHKWNELPESTLEEVIAFGYVYHQIYGRYKIKFELIPTRTMRLKEG